MKLTTKKRQIILSGLVLFLGVAVLANWYYSNPEKNAQAVDNISDIDVSNVNSVNLGDAVYVNSSEISDEYFAGAKLSRDKSYDEAVATLKEIIDSSDIDEQSIKTATESMNQMSQYKIAQTNIENLVKAKTGSECVAVINDSSVEIIVADSSVTEQTILQIKDIVMKNFDISAEKISIIGTK